MRVVLLLVAGLGGGCASFVAAPPSDDAGARGDADASDSSAPPPAADAALADGAPKDAFASRRKLVFVTKEVAQGNITVAGADARCNIEASNAGRSGTFVAWLSTASMHAVARIDLQGSYEAADGTVVFATTSAIAAKRSPEKPIVLAADGTPVLAPSGEPIWVYTGTSNDGTRAAPGAGGDGHCTNWTSNEPNGQLAVVGEPATPAKWSDVANGYHACYATRHFLCFEK